MRRRARHAETLNDRLVFKMVHDRRPILTDLADKVLVREYIASIVGVEHLAPCLVVTRNPKDIDWRTLPQEYVIKVNHGSGGIVIVTSDAVSEATLPPVGSKVDWARFRVKPDSAHPDRIMDLCSHWLTLDYSWSRGRPSVQWCYQNISRHVLVEELLRDVGGYHPREYRLFVIGGSVAFAQAEIDMYGEHRTAVMSPTWDRLPVQFVEPPPRETPERPGNWQEMIEVAERLAGPIVDFVRVDVYDLGDRFVVGEMTHYPSGGLAPISSTELARVWGRNWPIPY